MRGSFLIVCTLVSGWGLLACGADDGSGDPSSTGDLSDGGEVVGPSLQAGYYLIEDVTAAAECAHGGIPADGDFALVESGSDGVSVAFGATVLGAIADPGVFIGCETGELDADGNAAFYRYSELTLTEGISGYDADLLLDRISNGDLHPCTGVSFSIRPLDPCEPEGHYQTTSSRIVSGSCDLTWAPAEVTISTGVDDGIIDWNGSQFDDAELDSSACQLSATRGISRADSLDAYVYNGSLRRVEMTLSIDGMMATATITDALDGPTDFDESCEGATFDVTLERVTGIADDIEIQPMACGAERPPVCGDRVCEASESCRTCLADCGCEDGEVCTGWDAPICLVPCADVTVPGQCGEGERCGVTDEPSFVIYTDDATYCQESAGFGEGETCTSLSDCADGLLCHRSTDFVSSLIGVCSQPCGTCENGYICQSPSDGSNNGSFPTLPSGCSRRCDLFDDAACPEADLVCSDRGGRTPTCVGAATSTAGVGTDCSEDSCLPGLACIRSTVGTEAQTLCRLPCDVDADCTSVGGSCQPIGATFGACL
jgi:hypothetical protein